MRFAISPEIAYLYATRLCEFVNLELSDKSWRSLFSSDAPDDDLKRFKKAVLSRVSKRAFRALQKSHPSIALDTWQETVFERFSPPSRETFDAVRELQQEIKASLEKGSVAAQKVKEESKSFWPPFQSQAEETEGSIQKVKEESKSFWKEDRREDFSPLRAINTSRLQVDIAPLFAGQGEKYWIVIKTPDLWSELNFLFALALGARVVKKCECPCGRFFAIRTKKEKSYYSPTCAQGKTVKERVTKYRQRRAQWKKAEEDLRRLLADIDTIEQKQKLQRPRTGQQILEESERALEKARAIFEESFPGKRGQEYGKGKVFLAHASEQIKRLRKKTKGY